MMDEKSLADALEFAQEELRLCRERRRHYAPGTYSDAMRVMDLERWETIVKAIERVRVMERGLPTVIEMCAGWTDGSAAARQLIDVQVRLADLISGRPTCAVRGSDG